MGVEQIAGGIHLGDFPFDARVGEDGLARSDVVIEGSDEGVVVGGVDGDLEGHLAIQSSAPDDVGDRRKGTE